MPTSNRSVDEDLIGAELAFGPTPIGHVLGVRRDPISQRVWRLIATYGPHQRRVAVPTEWVVRRTPTRVTLAVGTRELDDLPDQPEHENSDIRHQNSDGTTGPPSGLGRAESS